MIFFELLGIAVCAAFIILAALYFTGVIKIERVKDKGEK